MSKRQTHDNRDSSTPIHPPRKRPGERLRGWIDRLDVGELARRASRARLRTYILTSLAVAAVTLGYLYYHFTNAEAAKKMADSYLERLFGVPVSIGHASFSLFDDIRVENITLRAPAPYTKPIFVAEEIRLQHNPWALLRGKLDVTEVVLIKPKFNLVRRDEEPWNYQKLLALRRPDFQVSASRPIVRVRQGHVTFRRETAENEVYSRTLGLSGLVLPNPSDRHVFTFQADLTTNLPGQGRDLTALASGHLNIKTGKVHLETRANNLPITPQLRGALPPEARQVWDRLKPSGMVNLRATFSDMSEFEVSADFMGVNFSYVHNETRFAFEGLTGKCRLTQDGFKLERIRGQVNSVAVALDGQVKGFDPEKMGVGLTIQAIELDIAEGRRICLAFWPGLKDLFQRYQPKGRATLTVTVKRPTNTKEKPVFEGKMSVRDGELLPTGTGHYITDITGEVAFGPREVVVNQMSGKLGSGTVAVNGRIDDPGPEEGVNLVINAQNVYLDENFAMPFPPKGQKIYNSFHPKGLADVQIKLLRKKGPGHRRETEIRFHLLDAEIFYDKFPYKLEHICGDIHVTPKITTIRAARGRHGDAVIQIDGTVTPRRGKRSILDIKVTGSKVPLDADLEAAFAKGLRKQYHQFHPSGHVDIPRGRIFRNADTNWKISYEIHADLDNAKAIYEPFPYPLHQLTGQLVIRPQYVEIKGVKGKNGTALVTVTGWAKTSPAGRLACDIVLTGTDIELTEELHGALGGQAFDAWTTLAPKGVVDARAHLTRGADPGSVLHHNILVTAKERASITFSGFPYTLQRLKGELTITDDKVRFQDLTCRNGSARLTLSGSVDFLDKAVRVNLAVDAKRLALDRSLREALPGRFQTLWQQMKPFGTIDVSMKKFTYEGRMKSPHQRGEKNGPYVAEWKAEAILDGVGFSSPLAANKLIGKMQLDGRDEDGRLKLDGKLRIYQGTMENKALSQTALVFAKDADSPRIYIRSIEGNFYDGRIEGYGIVTVSEDPKSRSDFGLNLSISDVNLQRFLVEGFDIHEDIEGGRLAGRIVLRSAESWGTIKAPRPAAIGQTKYLQGLEARGDFHVTDAKLYRLPVVMKMLTLLQLGAGEKTAFHEVSAKFFLRKGRFILEDIQLVGSSLSLHGAGSIEPGGKLRLSFLTGRKQTKPFAPALSELMAGLRKEIVVVEVTGTLKKPKVQMRSLTELTAPMRELLNLIREQRAATNSKKGK